MVTINHLHFDVLGLVLSYLKPGDLFTASLVSKSFNQAAIPKLYYTVTCTHSIAKRHPVVRFTRRNTPCKILTPADLQTQSPFHVILAQPSLSIHVRACGAFISLPISVVKLETILITHNEISSTDISALPMYKSNPDQAFLSDCIRALDLCTNLTRFRLAPNVLPSFLKTLSTKKKIQELHVNGSLTMDQSHLLSQLTKLKVLRLDHSSWCLMHILPSWISQLGSTLTSLTITVSPSP